MAASEALAVDVPARRPGPPLEEALGQAALVVESQAFACRERAGERVVARYTPRAGGDPFLLRHRTPDVGVLGEVFGERLYEPPPEVQARLDAPAVVDAGANIGLFGVFARARLGARRVTSFEPDRFNLMLLRPTARPAGDAWRVVEACASVTPGAVPFCHGEFACSRMEGEDTVEAVDLFVHLAGADLLKLDVEGGEWPVLDDPRLAEEGPEALVLEYHPFGAPGPDARACAHERLERAGYATREVVHRAEDGVGMLWAWRPT
jgi:FkbM family methyltransferase